MPWKAKNEVPVSTIKPKYTFAQHGLKLVGYGFITFGLLVIVAILFPPSLGPVPTEGIEATKPPWLFMGIFSIENWAGLQGLLWGAIIVVVLLILVPFLDRAKTQLFKDRKYFITVASLIVLLLGWLTISAYATKPKQHLGMASMGGASIQIDNAFVAKGLNESLDLVNQLKMDIINKDQSSYKKDSVQLDQNIVTLKSLIMSKDSKLGKKINTDKIVSLLSENSPNYEKINTLISETEASIKQAQTLFPVGINAVIGNALKIITKIEEAITKQDKTNAMVQAEELDQSIDPVKDAIKALDASLVAELNTDGLAEALNDANPNWVKASNILTVMKNALVKANNLSITTQLDKESSIITQLQQAIKNQDRSSAQTQAENLDQTLDPLKDIINEKNPDLVKKMGTDELNEELKSATPNWKNIQPIADQLQNAVNDAKNLYESK